MGLHYATRDFFRQMPNWLLARYFQERGLFADLDFTAMKETKPDALFAAWMELPEENRNRMDAEFREVALLSSEQGFCAIRDEAEWQLRETPEAFTAFVEKLAALDGHFERAMVTFLDHGQFWKGALLFCHADSLAYWRKRKGFPHVAASVHEDGRNELAESIRPYFRQIEGRGNNCVVDAFRRGELDYFFAYPEDYSQQSIEWVEGAFARRPHNPAFEVIFVYSQKDGTLDLNYRGGHKALEPLQAMFASAILKLPELPPDPEDTRIYDLDPLSKRGFQFVYESSGGIESVAVKKLRLTDKVVRGDRITLEADAGARADAIYDLLEKVEKSVPLKLCRVTQAEVVAKIATDPKSTPKSETFRITYPNSCSLKYDDMDLKLRKMLLDSGIEPKRPSENPGAGLEEKAEG
jgi:hypothetical protein